MALIFYSPINPADVWEAELKKHLPELDFRRWEAPGDKSEIDMALCWKPPPGGLAKFPNLKVIFSLAAGIDSLTADPALPDVPIVRMVEPSLTAGVAEYVLLHVLRHHKDQPRFAEQQKARIWQEHFAPPAWTRRVGLLGLGAIGAEAARMLVAVGFEVAGWSRTQKHLADVTSYFGPDQLDGFLARSDILVCLLPKTRQTDGILNAALFAKLPQGASLINAGRGDQLIEDDLLAALDSGQLSQATLDVFATEPLPPAHPFWAHPRITVTPHSAGDPFAASAARVVAENIRRFRAGQPLPHLYDRKAGY
ncbi:MAG: glyoxylate/hydroxypyruvate reductase A [Rhodospirillales bacterium]|nr:MAG: glyoxylate/hydroxypyruvate reductase A [Rhodospirillales bacterium]